MIPWDFGLINALKEKLKLKIFPAELPDNFPEENLTKMPYWVFELKNIKQGINLTTRGEFQMRVVEEESSDNNIGEYVQIFNNISGKDFELRVGKAKIGVAKIKLEKVVTTKKDTILNFIALLNFDAIYEDIDGENYE